MTKTCTVCKIEKDLSSFGKSKNSKDGLNQRCKKCATESTKLMRRTKEGLITKIYSSQRSNSKMRNHPEPAYTKQEFKEWMHNQNNFYELYENWKKNNFNKKFVPSVDRIDDFKPYTFDNIRLTSWCKNEQKANKDKTNGVGTQGLQCKKVYQYTKDKKTLIATFISTSDAARKTDTYQSGISRVATGKEDHANNFYWSFEEINNNI